MATRVHSGGLAAVAVWIAATVCGAQVMQAPGTLPNGRQVPFPPQFMNRQQMPPRFVPPQQMQPQQVQTQPAQTQPVQPATAAPPTPVSGALPPSLLDKPAQPAKVTLNSGDLAVQADNSSLTQILHDLSSSTGMMIDGLDKDQRVFGSYGPADPREVLSALLQDSGYNVMMVGATAGGAPRELLLTPRNGPALSSMPQSRSALSQDDDAVEDEPVAPADPNTLQPGVVPGSHPPNQNQPATPGAVRTPQQMLQELQQMRQQQQQQQTQPQ